MIGSEIFNDRVLFSSSPDGKHWLVRGYYNGLWSPTRVHFCDGGSL